MRYKCLLLSAICLIYRLVSAGQIYAICDLYSSFDSCKSSNTRCQGYISGSCNSANVTNGTIYVTYDPTTGTCGGCTDPSYPYCMRHNSWCCMGTNPCDDGSCFLPGTKIATPGGETKIENLEPGDEVVSFDPDTGSISASTVSQNYSRTVDDYYIVKTASGKEIKVTGEHPLFTGSEPQIPKTTLQKLQQFWFEFQTNIKYGWEETKRVVGI